MSQYEVCHTHTDCINISWASQENLTLVKLHQKGFRLSNFVSAAEVRFTFQCQKTMHYAALHGGKNFCKMVSLVLSSSSFWFKMWEMATLSSIAGVSKKQSQRPLTQCTPLCLPTFDCKQQKVRKSQHRRLEPTYTLKTPPYDLLHFIDSDR